MIPTSFEYKQEMQSRIRESAEFIVEIAETDMELQEKMAEVNKDRYTGLIDNPEALFGDAVDREIRYAVASSIQLRDELLFVSTRDENVYASGIVVDNDTTRGQSLRPEQILFTLMLPERMYLKNISVVFGDSVPYYAQVLSENNELLDAKYLDREVVVFNVDGEVEELIFTAFYCPYYWNGGIPNVKIAGVKMGKVVEYGIDNITDTQYSNTIDVTSENLPALETTITLTGELDQFDFDNPENIVQDLQRGQVIKIKQRQKLPDGTYYDLMLSNCLKLFSWSSSQGSAQIIAKGRMDFMDKTFFFSRMGRHSLYELANDVMEAAEILYCDRYIDESLEEIYVNNPIPAVPISQALQLVANAGMCRIRQRYDGVIALEQSRQQFSEAGYNLSFDTMLDVPYNTQADKIKEITMQVAKWEKLDIEELVVTDSFETETFSGNTSRKVLKEYFTDDPIEFVRCKMVEYVNDPRTGKTTITKEFEVHSDYCREVMIDTWRSPSAYRVDIEIYGIKYRQTGKEYFSKNYSYLGESKTWNNPLFDTVEQAEAVADWIFCMNENLIKYNIPYRGDASVEAGDIISQENKFVPGLTTLVEKNMISYSGGYMTGSMETRRYKI